MSDEVNGEPYLDHIPVCGGELSWLAMRMRLFAENARTTGQAFG